MALAFALAPALATARDAGGPAPYQTSVAAATAMAHGCHSQQDGKPGKPSPHCCVAGCVTETPAVAGPLVPAYVARIEPAAPRGKTFVSHARGVEPPPPRTV